MAVVAPPLRALIYVRQSKGSERSIAEQEVECREVCGREGWEIVDVLTDYVGASRRSKGTRTGWASVKQTIASGEIDVLVCWESSRAQRDLTEYAALRDICSSAGVVWCYSGSTYDLATSEGRFRTGLDALLSENEAEKISERIRRATRANAKAGRPHGRVAFGYQRIYDPTTGALLGQEPHPQEAEVVREAFAWYLSGLSLRSIARNLNEGGVRTRGTKRYPDGVEWTDPQVRRLLTNPAYAGVRVHRGQVVGEAAWSPLVDPEVFERVQARLVAQRTNKGRMSRTPRLLTAVARCGKCGGRIVCIHDRRARKIYTCKEKYEVGRDMLKADAFVTEAVLERLARLGPEALDEPDEDDEVRQARERVEELRQRLEDAAEQYAEGKLSAAMLAKVEAKLTPQIAEAEREARAAMVPISLEVPSGDLREWWDALAPEQRREVVGAVISTVVIKPTRRGVRTFDPSAVEIVWR